MIYFPFFLLMTGINTWKSTAYIHVSPDITQFIFKPSRHFKTEFQQQFRQSYVWLAVEGAQEGFRLGVHRWVDTTLAATKALCTVVLPDLAEKPLALAESAMQN
jgi:hypothetical protein